MGRISGYLVVGACFAATSSMLLLLNMPGGCPGGGAFLAIGIFYASIPVGLIGVIGGVAALSLKRRGDRLESEE